MEMNISTVDTFPSETRNTLIHFSAWFAGVHGYASLVVCCFGICTNIFNISVLTRKDMWTPTNLLLTWLAVSDILTMIPYIPFAIHFYCEFTITDNSTEKYSYGWTAYMLALVNLAATTHTISIWLGVSLAVFRFIQLRSTAKGPIAKKRRMIHAKVMTILVFVLSSAVLIPNYLTNKIVELRLPNNKTVYVLSDLKLATNETEPIVLANVLSYAIIAKLIPCALMITFGGSLLYSLGIKGRQRRRRLSTIKLNGNKRGARQSKTTRMLLVVIILFLVTEFPQGVLIFMSSTIPGFYTNIYMPLGDLMDFLALVNNAINFVLYCSMSNQFRSRFLEMYFNKKRGLKKFEKLSLTQSYPSITRTAITDLSIKRNSD